MSFDVNGREYSLSAGRPAVAICLDGCDPSYLDAAAWRARGSYFVADAAMPTFTNPNNVSIITGVAPAVHGICGNHFYDRSSKSDVPMNSRAYLRCPTILDELATRGARVLSVTSKQKLLEFVAATPGGHAFSAEKPGELGLSLAGRAPGDIYSADASLWVLDAGIAAVSRGLYDFVYLSTTDYVQHKHAPGSAEAVEFHAALEARIVSLIALGAVVGFTADHGMNAKPRIVYLRPFLGSDVHVTLPITDPYVVHHGALGGCAMVYLGSSDSRDEARARAVLSEIDGVERVFSRAEAARELELPAERIGELVVVAAKDTVLGKSEAEHDLSHLGGTLRSHGSLHERRVPVFVGRPGVSAPADRFTNADLFSLLLISSGDGLR
jgi:phosphonoacetate hydrolase